MAFRYSPKIVTDGLVLCLDVANPRSFVSGSTTYNDLTPNQTRCSITGGVTLQDNHLYFPGPPNSSTNDSVLVGGTASTYSNLTQVTAEAWCYPMVSSSYQYLISNTRDCCGTYNGYGLRINNSIPSFSIWNGMPAPATINSTMSIGLNQWYHIVGTYNQSQIRIYVNGVLRGTSNTTAGIGVPSSFSTYVGRMGYSVGTFYKFQGYIDVSRIYNRSLSANEILQNYNSLKNRFGL